MDDENFIYNLYGLKSLFKSIKAEVKDINNGRLTKTKANSENARAAGNQLYTQKNREQDTLIYYTKSIAYAPEDSEELALGFGNRSALLMHLNYYEECLIDVNRALEITKSDQLKSKLQSRKEKCLLLMEQLTINNGAEKTDEDCETNRQLKVTEVTSSKIPCAAECVLIKDHKKYKRQLIATRNIKPGEIVITEKAYACVPETSKAYLHCSHCLRFTCNGIPCNFCAHLIYCSEICKEEAWKEYHDIECSILHSIHAILFKVEHGKPNSNNEKSCGGRDVILLARVFIKAIKIEGLQNILNETELIDNGLLDLFSDGIFEGNKFGYIYNLRCGPQKETVEFVTYIKEMSILYLLVKRTNLIPVAKKRKEVNFSDEKLLLRLRDILIKLKSIIDFNAYTLTITYGPSFAMIDTAERKSFLEQIMHYTCECIACKDPKFFIRDTDMKGILKLKKVKAEYERIFGKHVKNFFFAEEDVRKWAAPTEASLKQALKLIELLHKHCTFVEACHIAVPLQFYVLRAFYELYDGKRAILGYF